MKLSIVAPCYNEAKNIPILLDRFNEVLKRDDIEVIIVENGSIDDSAAVLREYAASFPFLRIVSVETNRGYGFGILSGLREAKGEFLAWTHADLQTDPGDILKALDIIESKGHSTGLFVKGRRKRRRIFDNLFTVGMSVFETIYLGVFLWDINAQPNMFHRSFFSKWVNPPHDFSLDLYVYRMARKHGLAVVRFPVVFSRRLHGQSNWNTNLGAKWKFIRRTVEFSARLKHDIRYGIHSSQDQHGS
ncbi:MAG: glycosyltransferase family 2 protein [bacterium]